MIFKTNSFIKNGKISFCFVFLILFLFENKELQAQSFWKGWMLETTIHRGHILRHTEKITIDNSQAVWGEELNFGYQTCGKRAWNTWQRFPQMGLSFLHFGLGSGAHGEAFGALPNLSLSLFSKPRWDFQFRLGTGLAWISKPFDYQTNPTQNAIGSHWNNTTQFRADFNFHINTHIRLLVGGSFTHFSNGGTHRPNYGLNVPTVFLSGQFFPMPLEKKNYTHSTESKKLSPLHRWGGLMQAGLAFGESQTADGPSYPIYTASIAGARYFNKINRFLVGMDWELHTGIEYFLAHSNGILDEQAFRPAARRVMIFVADEFLFGSLGIHLQTGIYVSRRSELVPLFFYNKLAFRYYLPQLFGTRLRPWAGVYLKSHKITAEYISFNGGLSF